MPGRKCIIYIYIYICQTFLSVVPLSQSLLPSDISNIFDYNSAIHKYKTRSATNQGLFVPEIFTSNYGTKSIKYQGPLLWNDICNSVPSINDVHSLMTLI